MYQVCMLLNRNPDLNLCQQERWLRTNQAQQRKQLRPEGAAWDETQKEEEIQESTQVSCDRFCLFQVCFLLWIHQKRLCSADGTSNPQIPQSYTHTHTHTLTPTYTHTHTQRDTHIYTNTQSHRCGHTYTQTLTYTYTDGHKHSIHTDTREHTYMHTYTHSVHTYTHIQTYTHTYAHLHMHTHSSQPTDVCGQWGSCTCSIWNTQLLGQERERLESHTWAFHALHSEVTQETPPMIHWPEWVNTEDWKSNYLMTINVYPHPSVELIGSAISFFSPWGTNLCRNWTWSYPPQSEIWRPFLFLIPLAGVSLTPFFTSVCAEWDLSDLCLCCPTSLPQVVTNYRVIFSLCSCNHFFNYPIVLSSFYESLASGPKKDTEE